MNRFSILYVEDDELIREGLRYLLATLCDEFYSAKDGKEGLELYDKHHPDLIISDIKMPRLNGIEMTKEIKKNNPKQRIIFTTAHTETEMFLEAINLQVDGYLLKPIDFNLLTNRVKTIKNQIFSEQKIEHRNRLIREIIDIEDNILFIMDSSYKIIFANNSFYNFFKVSSIKEFKEKYNCIKELVRFDDGKILQAHKWLEELRMLSAKNEIIDIKSENYDISGSFLVSIKITKDRENTILVLTDITDIQKEKEYFKYKSFRDELTNIYNRAFFNEELKNSILRYRRDHYVFSLIMFDIDFFKTINDRYGHKKGDEILKELSKLVLKNIRKNDILARWGGEEFMIIASKADKQESKKIADNLREKIEMHTFSNGLSITCSFGVTEVEESDSEESLLKRVDKALYESKNSGRNRVIVS